MSKGEHLPKVGSKEQRMYEHILSSAKKLGKYKGREQEVAARTVFNHHQQDKHKAGT
ncbi:hypothetical protein HYW42_03815 [Candidatus Daviesbacteria bacterium]|nr:hypothetical protein [Candidatus Daviesbacteria bacterium]